MSEPTGGYTERVRAHYRECWDDAGSEVHFRGGPWHELPAGFVILEFAPRASRAMWTYATCGMSRATDPEPIELHIFSPRQSLEVVELLVASAHFHNTGHRLGLAHSVNFGKPWLDASNCDHGIISLPYLDGPTLEVMDLPGGKIARFYWLVPVTASEVEYKKRLGLEELERKLEAANFDYLDPLRQSVC